MFELLKNLTASRAATEGLHDLLDQSREAVAEAKSRLTAIEGAPQDLETSLAAFDAWLDHAATDAVDRLNFHQAASPEWRGPQLPIIGVNVGDRIAKDASPAAEVLFGLIALIGRDHLREVVKGQLLDRLGGEAGMTASIRAKKTTAALADILLAELAEEAIVRTMEGAGVAVYRSPDADPRALMASDDSIPK